GHRRGVHHLPRQFGGPGHQERPAGGGAVRTHAPLTGHRQGTGRQPAARSRRDAGVANEAVMARGAFLFPGQGAQYVGMGAALAGALPAARSLFDQASAVLGYDLLEVCTKGPKERLDSTAVSQPAIYVASLAALEQLKQTEPTALDECIA